MRIRRGEARAQGSHLQVGGDGNKCDSIGSLTSADLKPSSDFSASHRGCDKAPLVQNFAGRRHEETLADRRFAHIALHAVG